MCINLYECAAGKYRAAFFFLELTDNSVSTIDMRMDIVGDTYASHDGGLLIVNLATVYVYPGYESWHHWLKRAGVSDQDTLCTMISKLAMMVYQDGLVFFGRKGTVSGLTSNFLYSLQREQIKIPQGPHTLYAAFRRYLIDKLFYRYWTSMSLDNVNGNSNVNPWIYTEKDLYDAILPGTIGLNTSVSTSTDKVIPAALSTYVPNSGDYPETIWNLDSGWW